MSAAPSTSLRATIASPAKGLLSPHITCSAVAVKGSRSRRRATERRVFGSGNQCGGKDCQLR